jgi:hypothetical protein
MGLILVIIVFRNGLLAVQHGQLLPENGQGWLNFNNPQVLC